MSITTPSAGSQHLAAHAAGAMSPTVNGGVFTASTFPFAVAMAAEDREEEQRQTAATVAQQATGAAVGGGAKGPSGAGATGTDAPGTALGVATGGRSQSGDGGGGGGGGGGSRVQELGRELEDERHPSPSACIADATTNQSNLTA
eukprot:g6422.t1